jgi:hypothetical protein
MCGSTTSSETSSTSVRPVSQSGELELAGGGFAIVMAGGFDCYRWRVVGYGTSLGAADPSSEIA